MTARCGRTFDEILLSGYIDGTLTQSEEQRVRIHLEDCPVRRRAVAEMAGLREVAMSSQFRMPLETEWSENPRTGGSRLSFGLGWLLLLVWALAIGAFALADLWRTRASLDVEALLYHPGTAHRSRHRRRTQKYRRRRNH